MHFVATDAHSNRSRAPQLEECIRYIEKKLGSDYVKKLFIDNPEKMVHNEYI